MVRVSLLMVALAALVIPCAQPLRAEDAPAPICDCKPMSITVRDASGRAVSAVSIKTFAFTLASLTINLGDTVTWTNNDSPPHTATSNTGVFDTGVLSMGASKSFTFNTAGTFPYHCEIHPFMTGSITVLPATAPALTNLAVFAIVNVPFVYTISATGSPTITYGATLPQGFQLNGAVITGTFTTAGSVTIPLTATNATGSDAKNLVVTVAASGSNDGTDITGNWVGTLKSKHYEQAGPSPKADTSNITLILLQTGKALSASITIAGTTPSFTTTGQTGNKNFWLLGTANADNIALSAHLDKKGTTITGTGIRYTSHGDEEFTFSAKKK